MNILKRAKNNIEYAYYRKTREKALKEMNKHKKDADQTIWKYWADQELIAIKKCIEIPLN